MAGTYIGSGAGPFQYSNNGGSNAAAVSDGNGNLATPVLMAGIGVITATSGTTLSLTNSVSVFYGSSAGTITMPVASNAAVVKGFTPTLDVFNQTTNTCTVAPSGADTFNGSTNTVSVATNYGSASFKLDPGTGAAAVGWIKK